MKVAIIGSRSLAVEDPGRYLPENTTEIVSGGAAGIDRCAAELARNTGIPLTEFLPQYSRYGRAAPILRNKQIVAYADCVIAFWDGRSKGTRSVIDLCQKAGKPCQIVYMA